MIEVLRHADRLRAVSVDGQFTGNSSACDLLATYKLMKTLEKADEASIS
jgi:hypothetical protein